jgi:hypothetical protein
MSNWKENKMLGIVAGIVGVLFLIVALFSIIKNISGPSASGPVPRAESEE